jgi:rhodanese-related sulfurtransferase
MKSRSRWFFRAWFLVLLAALPAAVSAWLHPFAPRFRMPEIPQIGVAAARNLAGALWVDARPVAEFDAGHVPGAVSLPNGAWDARVDAVLDAWQPASPIVVYCSSQDCDAAEVVARRLVREFGGDLRVFILRGGWGAWLGE